MPEAEIKTLNNRYKLIERIGSGGMAVVYKAQDMSLGRLVAIKMLHESLTDDEDFLRRFHREAHAAANLTHPNIVTVHDIGRDNHQHYIVMEYVDGMTLKDVIRQQYQSDSPMPISRALELTIQICTGVGYAHRANFVHCDVKPQNVLVTRDDRVKVADFGIARAISQASLHEDSKIWGTPQYFSPEQASGEAATPASDVYAIGIIMFELLSGRLPFEADSYPAMALKHMREKPPLITSFNPAVPRQLEQIINKVLAKEPAGRYRTAGQLGRILTSYRRSSRADTGTVPATPTARTAAPRSEQKTQLFQYSPGQRSPQRPSPDPDQDASPAKRPGSQKESPQTVYIAARSQAAEQTDWLAVGLGVTALLFLLGLIPLWYFVYRAWAG